jgi:hypothetical protein
MSEQHVKQKPLELLGNDDDDDIRSIAGSECEWTVDTNATNGGDKKELKLKMRILEVKG